MARRKTKSNTLVFLLAAVIVILAAVVTGITKSQPSDKPSSAPATQEQEVPALSAHFIDVGQGDCTLFVSGDETMLIDSGEYNYRDTVVDYLKEMGITELDYIVTTHAHSDHMGSMAYVIENIDVENIIYSEPTDSAMSKKFYGDFLDAVEKTDAEIIIAEPDYTFTLGEAECKILAPYELSNEENDNSVVMLISVDSASFLMTGDAEKAVEKKILEKYPDLNATILKAGHHGSKTSSHKDFIKTINAETAIICVGEDNSYNHPSEDILKIYEENKMDIYRTDVKGTITINCYKDRYIISTEK